MKKDHHFLTSYDMLTSNHQERHYCRKFKTEAEAIAHARKVSQKPGASSIRIAEMESWDDAEDVLHVVFMGFVPWV